MGLGSDERTKLDVKSSMKGSGNHTPPQREHHHLHCAPTAKFVGNGIIGEKRCLAWVWEDGKSGVGRQECASQDKLFGSRGRWQE